MLNVSRGGREVRGWVVEYGGRKGEEYVCMGGI